MITPRRTLTATALALALTMAAPVAHGAAATPTLKMFTGSNLSDGTPQYIAAAPDGSMWFTYATGSTSTLARVSPTGVITDLSGLSLTHRPYALAAGPDGNMWVTEHGTSGQGLIARITPGGLVTEYGTSEFASLPPNGIVAGPSGSGKMYFVAGTSGLSGAVGHITTSGTITTSTVGMPASMQPISIVKKPDDTLWFDYTTATDINALSPSLGITASTPAGLNSGNRSMAAGSDGNVWMLNLNSTFYILNRFNSTSPLPTNPAKYNLGSGATFFDVAVGADTNAWVTDTTNNGVVVVNPAMSVVSGIPALGAGSAPRGVAADVSGNIWVVGAGSPVKVWRYGMVAPTIGTVTATPSTTGATLSIPLNGNGQATTYQVNFGLPGNLTSITPVGSITDQSSGVQTVSASLTGLQSGTTYGYSVSATNPAGSPTNVTGTFTTTTPPVTPPPVEPPVVTPPATTPTTPTPPAGTDPTPPVDTAPSPPSTGDGDPQAVKGQTMVVSPVSGTVRIRPPGATTDQPMTAGGQVPVGSIIEATNGKVALQTATDDGVQTATFWGTRFAVRQPAKGPGMTTLVMTPRRLTGCRVAMARSRELVRELGRTRPPRRVLWGKDNKGLYRTQGENSVATVRGTVWSTTDTCRGTITRVLEGAVSVRDLTRKRTVLVRAGKSYLAPHR